MDSTMTEYKIEKNIPVPTRGGYGRWQKMVKKMDIGDSVEVKTISEARAFATALRKLGFGVITRDVLTDHPRVWKVVK